MEMTMKTAKLFFKTTCLFTAAILTGCTADVAQEEEKNKEPNPAATIYPNLDHPFYWQRCDTILVNRRQNLGKRRY